MRNTRKNQISITERVGNTWRMGDVECTPEDDATHVEYEMSRVIVA